MKKLLLLSTLLISSLTFAQVPQGISYQAIALNGNGAPVVSSNVGLRLSILDNTATGTVLYTETHTKTTNAQGLFNLVIGQGTAVTNTFAGINWKTNLKFLKVEMDAAGGTNYANVGTTQLLSVPYALTAGGLVLAPGQGITLTSPNGTPYQLTVDNNGQLSVPASSNPATSVLSSLYLYGTFNNYDPTLALNLGVSNDPSYSRFYGYRYLVAGSTIKFVGANNSNGAVYGINTASKLQLNAGAYNITTTGFYLIDLSMDVDFETNYYFSLNSISPKVYTDNSVNGSYQFNPTYSVVNNNFTYLLNGVTSGNLFRFVWPSASNNDYFGDNLADGTLESGGDTIVFPNATSTPKNYKIVLTLNFNGSASYVISVVP